MGSYERRESGEKTVRRERSRKEESWERRETGQKRGGKVG